MTNATTPQDAAREYVQLLLKLHELDPRGQLESKELDVICDLMDRPWLRMSGEERKRVKGLSQDLYALADGRQGVDMSPQEREQWRIDANKVLPPIFLRREVDPALDFLRGPFPRELPAHTIPFLQSRCWEYLGLSEVALVFMEKAERRDPRQAVCVLLILERLGRTEEALKCAERILADGKSTAEELYQAAAALLRPARQMDPEEARPTFERIIPILERALRVFLATPREQREVPNSDRYMITMLGFSHEQLGNAKSAIQLYSDGLAHYPGDVTLLTFRGFALIEIDPSRALSDFKEAALGGSPLMWPYYFLAWGTIHQRQYHDTWQWCLRALERSGGSNREWAQVHEWLGISMAELRQPTELFLYHFSKAEELDPASQQIQYNRVLAERRGKLRTATGEESWSINGRASGEQALRNAYSPPEPDLLVGRFDMNLTALFQPTP